MPTYLQMGCVTGLVIKNSNKTVTAAKTFFVAVYVYIVEVYFNIHILPWSFRHNYHNNIHLYYLWIFDHYISHYWYQCEPILSSIELLTWWVISIYQLIYRIKLIPILTYYYDILDISTITTHTNIIYTF